MMVDAVLQGISHMEGMLQNQAVMLNGVVQYCQALDQGQQVLLHGQAIIIHGQKVVLEEVLSLHNSVNNVLLVGRWWPPLCRLSNLEQSSSPHHMPCCVMTQHPVVDCTDFCWLHGLLTTRGVQFCYEPLLQFDVHGTGCIGLTGAGLSCPKQAWCHIAVLCSAGATNRIP